MKYIYLFILFIFLTCCSNQGAYRNYVISEAEDHSTNDEVSVK